MNNTYYTDEKKNSFNVVSSLEKSSGNQWFYTYVLKSRKDGKLYTGCTSALQERLEQHNNGLVYSTRHRRPLELIYFEACLGKDDAFRRERYLKTGMGKRYIRNRISTVEPRLFISREKGHTLPKTPSAMNNRGEDQRFSNGAERGLTG